jgi:hypothetical protein
VEEVLVTEVVNIIPAVAATKMGKVVEMGLPDSVPNLKQEGATKISKKAAAVLVEVAVRATPNLKEKEDEWVLLKSRLMLSLAMSCRMGRLRSGESQWIAPKLLAYTDFENSVHVKVIIS